MWYRISKYVLILRFPLAVFLVTATLFLGYIGRDVEIDYTFSKVIPEDHPTYQTYLAFQQTFGVDGGSMFIGLKNIPWEDSKFLSEWKVLGDRISQQPGVIDVLSLMHASVLKKDTVNKRFERVNISDSLAYWAEHQPSRFKEQWQKMPVYHHQLVDFDKDATFMVIFFETQLLNSSLRNQVVKDIEQLLLQFEKRHSISLIITGLPYIRTFRVMETRKELIKVLAYAVIILIFVLIILFRSASAVLFPMLVVGIGVVWSSGIIHLLGFKINILTGLIPNLMVIIGIPNCVYLLNKYHTEFRKHGNRIRSLAKVIESIGYLTFFANLTTAIGFGVFYFTNSSILQEFGITAFIMVLLLFSISLISMPILFSLLPVPKEKHMVHLDKNWINGLLDFFSFAAHDRKGSIYIISAILLSISVYGITQLEARGFILDDVPEDSRIYQDLKKVEQIHKGIMPLEILIDTRQRNGVIQGGFLQDLASLEDSLYAHPWFSKPISMTTGLKSATQAYFNGNPNHYRLPMNKPLVPEMNLVMGYVSNSKFDEDSKQRWVDSSRQVARVSLQIPDLGSHYLDSLNHIVTQKIAENIDTSRHDYQITGTSIMALEGYRYLTGGLFYSVLLAFCLIALIMGFLFRSYRMLLVALVPNLIPLVLTAGIMGFLDIPLKPSTVLVFSVAFGISVDFTIHYLAKYRQELARHHWDIRKTVLDTIQETGLSMIYTSMILFFGFISFMFSSFDGTVYLGLLVSITLIASLFSNMLLLPALLVSFDKVIRYDRLKKRSGSKENS